VVAFVGAFAEAGAEAGERAFLTRRKVEGVEGVFINGSSILSIRA
jgi:hypothetical protein